MKTILLRASVVETRYGAITARLEDGFSRIEVVVHKDAVVKRKRRTRTKI